MGHIAKDCKVKSNNGGKQVRCFRCNKTGHVEKFCRFKKQMKTGEGCSICKKNNHTEKVCYFRKNKDKNEDEDKVTFLTSKIRKYEDEDKTSLWIQEQHLI
jgi:hypothetical protein